jgi:hypothetical protein
MMLDVIEHWILFHHSPVQGIASLDLFLNHSGNIRRDGRLKAVECASAIKSSDLNGQVTLYDDPVQIYYARRNLSKADLARELASAYKTYSSFPTLNLSAVSSRTVSPGVVQVEFDKEFGAVRREGGFYEGSVHSELTLRQTDVGWRIAGEKDDKVHWTKKTP